MAKVKANWADPATTAENEVLPKYFKWAWTSRGLSLALNVILIMQLTYYCTDMLGSVNSFCAKLGSGIASALVGLIMGLAGYDGSLAVQSASANTSIIALFNYVPMILMIVLLLLAIAYKLDKELPQIKADLEAKRQAK